MFTNVIINEHTYIAEDVGGGIKEKRIDIFLGNDHQVAKIFGVQYLDVIIEVN